MAKKSVGLAMPGMDEALAAAAAGSDAKKDEVKVTPKKKPASTKANVNVKQEQKQEEKPVIEKKEKELKSVAMNLRVKESVRADFERMRAEYGYSQSDFFETMVRITKNALHL